MKQVEKTDQVVSLLRQNGVDPNSVSVFEAIALNTLPLRKGHPLYNGAKVDRSLLVEMANALATESRPLQAQHDSEPLPLGRVFHGEVVDSNGESELRALFFVSNTKQEHVTEIENGTIDQVSVSILPKQIRSSATGFDFLGESSTFENRYMGTDDKGNQMGKNGVFARLIGLDKWFELSLVGQGGAQNARIVRRDESHFGSSYQKLAASGVDPSAYVLTASATGQPEMDFTQLIASLDTKSTEIATLTVRANGLETEKLALTAKVAELETKLSEAGDSVATLAAKETALTEANDKLTATQADLTSAVDALKGVATKVLTAAGKQTDEVPEDVAALTALINETSTKLVAALSAGGGSNSADAGHGSASQPVFNSAFRRPR